MRSEHCCVQVLQICCGDGQQLVPHAICDTVLQQSPVVGLPQNWSMPHTTFEPQPVDPDGTHQLLMHVLPDAQQPFLQTVSHWLQQTVPP